MRCAWDAYLKLLPIWMRSQVDKLGKNKLQDLRLRLNAPPELITLDGSFLLERRVSSDDLHFTINAATSYSPWAASSVSQGFITAPGGHRIGLCGNAVSVNGKMTGIRIPTSLCIRVARDFPGIGKEAAKIGGSMLIIGKPGSGKTTLLRDLIRQKSDQGQGSIAVVDERGEIFPNIGNAMCFPVGQRTDVITGCPKPAGIEAVLRNMGPAVIAVDEITAEEDCKAILHAGWCGVCVLATAHAESKDDLYASPVYNPLVTSGLFQTVLILQADKSWKMERMKL